MRKGFAWGSLTAAIHAGRRAAHKYGLQEVRPLPDCGCKPCGASHQGSPNRLPPAHRRPGAARLLRRLVQWLLLLHVRRVRAVGSGQKEASGPQLSVQSGIHLPPGARVRQVRDDAQGGYGHPVAKGLRNAGYNAIQRSGRLHAAGRECPQEGLAL